MQRQNRISVNHFELWEFVWWKLINRKSIIIGSCKVVVELSLEFYDSNASYHSCYSQELKQIRKALATSFISGDSSKQSKNRCCYDLYHLEVNVIYTLIRLWCK